jgi:hypothetical protein
MLPLLEVPPLVTQLKITLPLVFGIPPATVNHVGQMTLMKRKPDRPGITKAGIKPGQISLLADLILGKINLSFPILLMQFYISLKPMILLICHKLKIVSGHVMVMPGQVKN